MHGAPAAALSQPANAFTGRMHRQRARQRAPRAKHAMRSGVAKMALSAVAIGAYITGRPHSSHAFVLGALNVTGRI